MGRAAIKGWLSLAEVESAAHFVLCGLVVLLAWLAYGSKWIFPLTVVALGALIGVLQFWVPGRSPSWSDFWVDCAGVIYHRHAGVLVYSQILWI